MREYPGPLIFDPWTFWGDECVRLMDANQVCACLRLFAHQWDHGSIPSDHELIAAILNEGERRYSLDEVGRLILPALSNFFAPLTDAPGRMVNESLSLQREAWGETEP